VTTRREQGITLLEIAVVVAFIGVMSSIAMPALDGLFTDQRAKGAARSVSDAFSLGRAEAIRTGNTHLVVFQGALSSGAPIAIVNDGAPDSSNCSVDPGEVVHTVGAPADVSWGTSTGLSNGTAAPDDPGMASSGVATGSSFTDASLVPVNLANWVLFEPDGLPRLFTPNGSNCGAVGLAGQGGGSIYLTNTRRDYAIVLSPLGTSRVHVWDSQLDTWRN
jgi:type II secretory pathway pseudopilin PulG